MDPSNKMPREIKFNKDQDAFQVSSNREAVPPEHVINRAFDIFKKEIKPSNTTAAIPDLYRVKKDAIRAYYDYMGSRSIIRKCVDSVCEFLHIQTTTSDLREKTHFISEHLHKTLFDKDEAPLHGYETELGKSSEYLVELQNDWNRFLSDPHPIDKIPEPFKKMVLNPQKYPLEALLKKASTQGPEDLLKLLAEVAKNPENKTLAYFLLTKAYNSESFKEAITKTKGEGLHILIGKGDDAVSQHMQKLALVSLDQIEGNIPFKKEWLPLITFEKASANQELIFPVYNKIFGKLIISGLPKYMEELQKECERLNIHDAEEFILKLRNLDDRDKFLLNHDITEFPLLASIALDLHIQHKNVVPPQGQKLIISPHDHLADLNKIARLIKETGGYNHLSHSILKAILPRLIADKIELNGDWKEIFDSYHDLRWILAQAIKNPSPEVAKKLFYLAGGKKDKQDIVLNLITSTPSLMTPEFLFSLQVNEKGQKELLKRILNPDFFTQEQKQAIFAKAFEAGNPVILKFCADNDPSFNDKLKKLNTNQLKTASEPVILTYLKQAEEAKIDETQLKKILFMITDTTNEADLGKALLKKSHYALFKHAHDMMWISDASLEKILNAPYDETTSQFLIDNFDIKKNTPLGRFKEAQSKKESEANI